MDTISKSPQMSERETSPGFVINQLFLTIQHCRWLFANVDADSDGTMDESELLNFLRICSSYKMSAAPIQKLIKKHDIDKNGSLNPDELKHLLQVLCVNRTRRSTHHPPSQPPPIAHARKHTHMHTCTRADHSNMQHGLGS